MGDFEEILKSKFLLVDSRDVKSQHALIIGFSILMFVTYGLFLWLMCSLTPSLIATLFLLASQVALGLPATRAYYDFGISARQMLRFYDSGVLGHEIETEDIRIPIGDISLVFEKINNQLQKYDRDVSDDFNDLAWFVIIVWSIISSLVFFQETHSFPFCIIGAVVLIITCFVCYISGFRTLRGSSLEEYFSHLEYYIEKYIQTLDDIFPSTNGTVILQVTKRKRNYALVDLILEFNVKDIAKLEYHLGLASSQDERFILESSSNVIERVFHQLKNLKALKTSRWSLEQITTQSGRILRLVNQKRTINISDVKSMIMSPSSVEKSVVEVGSILKQIEAILLKEV